MPQFHIRDHSPDVEKDVARCIAIADSTLPHLAALGSEGQWGTVPFSQQPARVQDCRDDVVQAERYRTTGEGEAKRFYAAEAQVAGELRVVGFITVQENWFAKYVEPLEHLQPTIEAAKRLEKGWTYLHTLMTNFDVDPDIRRGCGVALIEVAKEHVRKQGKKVLFLDCYNGGSQKLPRFYEKCGFETVGTFEPQKPDGTYWPGRLMKLEIE